jgi:hypothetical protein
MRALLLGLLGVALFAAGLAVGGYAVHTWERSPGLSPQPPAADAPPRVWEGTVYVPLTDNQGRRFTDEEWRRALDVLAADFGGATLGTEVEGWSLDPQKRVRREPVRPVAVSFGRDRLGDFRERVREVGRRLGQEAMYVRLEEPRVELLTVAPGNSEKDR